MTTATPQTARAANTALQRARIKYDSARKELAAANHLLAISGPSNTAIDRLIRAERTVSITEHTVTKAEQAAEAANTLIDRTDDHAADALRELIENHRIDLRLLDHRVVVRKRPGAALQEALPEVCVSQQEDSLNDGGIYRVKRLALTVYSAAGTEPTRIDTTTLADLINGQRQMSVHAIGSATAVERLDGGSRQQYALEDFSGHLAIPRLTGPTSHIQAISAGSCAADQISLWRGGEVWRSDAEAKVLVADGTERVVQVGVRIGGSANFAKEKVAESMCAGLVGRVVGGVGQVTKVELVESRDRVYTLNLTGESTS